MSLIFAMSALLAGQTPETSLNALQTLDRSLNRLENRLHSLRDQQTALTTELATLHSEIAAARLRSQAAENALQKRVRALARMPAGARLILLGSSESLGGFLRNQRVLRWLAKHDNQLRDRFAREMHALHRLENQLDTQRQSLEMVEQGIRHERDRVAEQRQQRLQLVSALLTDEASSKQAAKAKSKAQRALGALLGQLQPLGRQHERFASNRGRLPWPTLGAVDMPFGAQLELAFGTHTSHHGLRIKTAVGTPVAAIAQGTVVFAGWLDTYGQVVIIDHGDEFHTLMAHLKTVDATVGDAVHSGDLMGTIGDTGSLHGAGLYFEIRHRGQPQNPEQWLRPVRAKP